MNHIVLAGGSGFLGTALASKLLSKGFQVTCISRTGRSPQGALARRWTDDVRSIIDGADAVINLAGANVGAKRWSKLYRREILQSRIEATRVIVDAIAASTKPAALINASAVGYYGNTTVDVNEGHPAGATFLAEVTRQWEAEACRAKAMTRVALMRIGVVLDRSDGALAKLLPLLRLGLGGPLGTGRQWFPWVHRDDVVNAFLWAAEGTAYGPYNVVAPQQVTMLDFVQNVGRIIHRPAGLKVPSAVLRFLLGEQADIVLHGQRVRPFRLEADGFTFTYTNLNAALQNLLCT
jgi:uncharacterized protein